MAEHPGLTEDQRAVQPHITAADSYEDTLRSGLVERLGEARFGLWFGNGVRLGVNADIGILEVRVPDLFFQEWIQNHYTDTLLGVAEAITGRRLRLSVEVETDAHPPPTHGPAPAIPRNETQFWPTARDCLALPPPRASSEQPLCSALPFEARGVSLPETTASVSTVEQRTLSNGTPTTFQTVPPAKPKTFARSLHRLEDFATGPGNLLAYAAALQMADSAGAAFNPLVIHGGIGLGKTHLLKGVGQALRQRHPTLLITQVTAEAFTNAFLDAMRTGTMNHFRMRYRNTSGLIVDDIHFLAAKRATQDEFLHTFNALISKGAPIVLSADQHPRLISRLSDELVTRFLGGLVVKLEPPDFATRRAILRARATACGISVPDPVINYIAERLHDSVRELEGALHTVIAQATLTGSRLDLNLARTALRDTIRHTTTVVALRDIERAICQFFQTTGELLKSDSRTRTLAYARMLAMFLARKHTGASYSEIGRFFGGRSHSTVIAADRKVQRWIHAEQGSSLLPGFETIVDLLADLERTLGL
jgi:chromosomal replication initiator protein